MANYNWTTIHTYTYPTEAHMAKLFIESYGIKTQLKDELTIQVDNFLSNALGGIKLQVKDESAEVATNHLKEGGYYSGDDVVKKVKIVSLKDVEDVNTCPFCKAQNVTKVQRPNILSVVVCFLLGVLFPIYKQEYHCYECNEQWKLK